MMGLRNSFTIIVIFVFAFISASVQAQYVAEDKASMIDRFMTKLVENRQFNGSILVAEDGDVIFKKGYGFANMDWEIPNATDTKFRIGSITKQFVALMILQLVEENKLKLEGTLTDYLPQYRSDTGQRITIHHLLTHTSGIPSYTNLPGFWADSTRNPYNKDYMIKAFHSGDLLFEPGTEFRYNNTGYFLLAVIIERVTGKSFEQNLHERILIPANMLNSGVDRNLPVLKKRASGYINLLNGYVNEPYFYMLNVLGAGDMYSTADDLYLWDQALYSDILLSDKYKQIMFTPFLNNYAYGWGFYYLTFPESSDSLTVVTHSGGIKGFNARIFRLLDDEHLIVILNNTGPVDLWEMCVAIVNILYERAYYLPKKSLVQTLGKTILSSGIKYAIIQYHLLKSYKQGEYAFGENELNNLGYQLININRLNDAIDIFKLNIQEFPNSINPYNSLAEAYLLAGRKQSAIKYFDKSLELNPDNRKAMLMIEHLHQSK
jgi:CubicO group peptidase (beta-lactamase class C family)